MVAVHPFIVAKPRCKVLKKGQKPSDLSKEGKLDGELLAQPPKRLVGNKKVSGAFRGRSTSDPLGSELAHVTSKLRDSTKSSHFLREESLGEVKRNYTVPVL